jgi:coenzyme F420-0:L-glutamate ligase/coenzyme F420-1:gamma-L-glutamate ligase
VKSFSVFALEGFPLVGQGDDLGRIVVEAAGREGLVFEDGDVVVVAQKVFSKAEGRVVRLRDVVASGRARRLARRVGKDARFVELVLRESRRVLKASREVLLVEDVRGLVCINAGIDKSNVRGRGCYALLPVDPDASAAGLRRRIKALTGRDVGVVVCDTFSRPFRRGQANFAIGVSGVQAFRDYRGKKDLFGQVLRVKNSAVLDEVAAAAELVMGQAMEATPVVVFRGLKDAVGSCEECQAADLQISSGEDLFRGTLGSRRLSKRV